MRLKYSCSLLGNLGKKILTNYAVPLAKDVLPGTVGNIASNVASNAINKFQRRINGKSSCKIRKRSHSIYLEWRYELFY